MNQNDQIKQLSAVDYANQLFEAAVKQYNGDMLAASRYVLGFLVNALRFAISASSGADEDMRKGLQKEIGEAIVAAERHPACQ